MGVAFEQTVYRTKGIDLEVQSEIARDRDMDLFIGMLGARLIIYAPALGVWVRLSGDGGAVEVGRYGQATLCFGFRREYAIDRPSEAARVTVERLVDPAATEPQFRLYIPPGEDV